ncbi:hypothetical protein OZX65_03930 [Leuconostocaceae bacterium ESL0723]|nr:hypothetical protein OZX65_03930 [Leuconostocaceae bacterium ESL0723]
MSNKADALIEKNNELREQLNPENRKFYSDFMGYVRLKSLDKDERATELQLLAILQDLIDAQNDGVSAQDYFGKSPQAVGDDLIKSLPYNLKSIMQVAAGGIGFYLMMAVLPAMAVPEKDIDLGNLLLSSVWAMVSVLMIVGLISRNIYTPVGKGTERSTKMNWQKLLAVLTGTFCILGFILIFFLVKTPWQIRLAGWSGIAVISLIMVLGLIVFLRIKDKKPWWGIALFFGLSGFIGIGARIPIINHYLEMSLGKGGWGILLLLLFTSYSFLRGRYLKKQNKAARTNPQKGER